MKKEQIKPITMNATDIFEFLLQIKAELHNAKINMNEFDNEQMNKTIDKFTDKVISINNDDRFYPSTVNIPDENEQLLDEIHDKLEEQKYGR
jgi:hypothetical protein